MSALNWQPGGSVAWRSHEVILAQLSRLLVYALLLCIVWYGYEFWTTEVVPELNAATDNAELAREASNTQARESIFIIFAALLGGPLVLLLGWIAVGLVYNIVCDGVGKCFPPGRFLVLPLLLMSALYMAEQQKDQLKYYVTEGYRMVDARVAFARDLRVGHSVERPALRDE